MAFSVVLSFFSFFSPLFVSFPTGLIVPHAGIFFPLLRVVLCVKRLLSSLCCFVRATSICSPSARMWLLLQPFLLDLPVPHYSIDSGHLSFASLCFTFFFSIFFFTIVFIHFTYYSCILACFVVFYRIRYDIISLDLPLYFATVLLTLFHSL